MTVVHELDDTNGKNVNICLRPGMAWILYSDDGPGGPCGQSMRTTCPHTVLHVFTSEAEMRAYAEEGVGRNKKARVEYGVVDEWTAAGVFQVVMHGEKVDDGPG